MISSNKNDIIPFGKFECMVNLLLQAGVGVDILIIILSNFNIAFMRKLLLLVVILVLGASLRFVGLGRYPQGFSQDEAAKGYNAYSILKTGKDMRGNHIPLRFTDFSDKRPYTIILYTYLLVPSILVFGLNEFSVRLPAAVVGTLTVFVLYLLTKKVFKNDTVGLLAAFLLSISPWHILMSRVGLEAITFPFLFLTSWYILIIGLEKPNFGILAAITRVASFYSYQASYVVIPAFLTFFYICYKDRLNRCKNSWRLIVFLVIAGILPLIYLYIKDFPTMAGHLRGESLSNSVRSEIFLPLAILSGIYHYVSPRLLLLYHIPTLVGFYYGLLLLARDAHKEKKLLCEEVFLLLLLGIVTVPSAFSSNSSIPNITRSIGMIGIVEMLASYGIYRAKDYFSPSFGKLFVFAIFLNSMLMIYLGYPKYLGSYIWLQYGFKEVVKYVENTGNKYDRIVVTDKANQPFIYFLFYSRFPPERFHKERVVREYTKHRVPYENVLSFDRYIFCDISECYGKYNNALYIARPNEVPNVVPLENVRIEGKEVFSILISNK